MMLSASEVRALEFKANDLRQDVIRALAAAGSGHTAGALGMADVFTVLFFRHLRLDPNDPTWPERDRLILSNAHICPILYAALAHRGFCKLDEFLQTLRRFGSPFQGHSMRDLRLGIETSGGPLGQGLSQAIGMTLAARMEQASWRVFAMLSDGEMNEGQTWEAALLAGKEKLHRLVAIIDRNHIQIDGNTEDILPLEPLGDKWRAFGWHVIDVNGHDMTHLVQALERANSETTRPTIVIAHTTPGKGVSFMENQYVWHGKTPSPDEAMLALTELAHSRERI